MFYLIWQMGFWLLVAFGLGLFFGRQIWSGDARSAEADKALAEAARLRAENENLARRLGDVESRPKDVKPAVDTPAEKPVRKPAEPAKKQTRKEAPEKAAMAPAETEPTPEVDAVIAPEAVVITPEAPGGDDLTAIKGLGPKAAAALNDGGITRFSQIAAWTDTDIADWDARINGRGRITRDNWVGQARDLG